MTGETHAEPVRPRPGIGSAPSPGATVAHRHAAGQLAAMLKVGTIGFGGGSALIPLFDDELVSRRRVLDAPTFTRHTVVASITPGALPVKLGGLAGLHTSGPWLSLAMAVAVALPGTALTLGLVAALAAGGESAVRYVELASVGITVFIVALLVHYIDKVLRSEGSGLRVAVVITVLSFLATGAAELTELAGRLMGRSWDPELPRLTAVQLIGAALAMIAARALLRREHVPHRGEPPTGPLLERRFVRAAMLLAATAAGGVLLAVVVAGPRAGELLGLVALSTVTSFGGGEAYVGVADGFFVAGGYVTSSMFYSQLVPIANALPGPILVKLAAGIGYGVGSVDGSLVDAWVLGIGAALVAIGSCTAVAVLVMGAYHRAGRSPVVRDIGRYILPVICGLLVTTSAAMFNASADVAERAQASPAATVWLSLTGVAVVTTLRHLRLMNDVVLLLCCGGISLGALLVVAGP